MDLFDPFPLLETTRLFMRETTIQDAAEVCFLRSDASMLKHLKKEPMRNHVEARSFVAGLHAKRRAGESVEWCITRKPESRMIGSICLWNFSADRKKGEVGYLLHPSHWKQGIMSEALSAVLAFGFGRLQLTTIEAFTHRDNGSSLKMLRQHGFADTSQADPDDSDNVVLAVNATSFLS